MTRRRKRGGKGLGEAERALLDELARIYQQVDATYGGYTCEGTTECCRFGLTGRQPYVTSIELLAVRRAIAARGGRPGDSRRPLPLLPTGPRQGGEEPCPMLDRQARCTIYQARPLGCRSHWCQRARFDVRVSQKALNALVQQIRQIALRHHPEGDRGRPLTRALIDDLL